MGPNPGKAGEFLANAATAKAIHERLGAQVMMARPNPAAFR